jgi:hypothetical protein
MMAREYLFDTWLKRPEREVTPFPQSAAEIND